jgi:fatty-acyl-CoA synthase
LAPFDKAYLCEAFVEDSKAALRDWIRALEAIRVLDERAGATLAALVGEAAAAHAASPALIGVRETLTYGALAGRVNQYGRWAVGEGFAAGDVVCLLMPNCPDYAAIWLGLTQVGCVVALLNTNLTGGALAHCIDAAKPRGMIVAAALLPMFVGGDAPASGVRIWVHGDAGCSEMPRIDLAIAGLDDAPLADDARGALETALLIYTSGTTGLPKAAKVTQRQLVEWSFWFAGMMDARPEDRLYNCLPMYHSIGGVVAVGAMLVRGGSVLIREKFSASRFWDDIVDGECTVFQYIGELCRYLVQSPAHARETAHRLRLCCGNGLQGGTWEQFTARFNIPRILEYYAATEGVVSLYNCEGKPGAIGRVPGFLNHRFPIALVRCDIETGVPLRDANGFCTRCGPDEAGEAIGKLDVRPGFYTDEAASERKILRDVFAAGDCWFRTGDLMRRDAAGFYYFVDRMGETFRWKGENVATTEVAAVVSAGPGVVQAVVFGVEVPGHEGKAGMAAITTGADFDMAVLLAHMARHLAAYARPVFLRLCQSLESTGTFKLQKSNLQREGLGADDVWFCDYRAGSAVKCDKALINDIAAGRVRV